MRDLKAEWDKYHATGDAELRESLILHCMPLVRYVVGRFVSGMPNDIERGDLVDSGVYGVIDAVERYDPDRNMKFETYAIMRIRGAVLDELRALSFNPRSARKRAKNAESIRRRLRERYRDTPVEEQLEDILDADADAIHGPPLVSFISMHEPSPNGAENSESSLFEKLEDTESRSAFEQVVLEETLEALARAVDELPKYERLVITHYYYEGMLIKEIGKLFDVTESRISQVHGRAIKRLRDALSEYA